MISPEQALQLQAYVDQALTASERGEVEAWMNKDPEARGLYEELHAVGQLLRENETVRALPEDREFYWSRIAQGIERERVVEEAVISEPRRPWWRVWLAPLGAAAGLVGALLFLVESRTAGTGNPAVLAIAQEVESPLEEVSSFTFRAESENMTVVWVNFRDQ